MSTIYLIKQIYKQPQWCWLHSWRNNIYIRCTTLFLNAGYWPTSIYTEGWLISFCINCRWISTKGSHLLYFTKLLNSSYACFQSSFPIDTVQVLSTQWNKYRENYCRGKTHGMISSRLKKKLRDMTQLKKCSSFNNSLHGKRAKKSKMSNM